MYTTVYNSVQCSAVPGWAGRREDREGGHRGHLGEGQGEGAAVSGNIGSKHDGEVKILSSTNIVECVVSSQFSSETLKTK